MRPACRPRTGRLVSARAQEPEREPQVVGPAAPRRAGLRRYEGAAPRPAHRRRPPNRPRARGPQTQALMPPPRARRRKRIRTLIWAVARWRRGRPAPPAPALPLEAVLHRRARLPRREPESRRREELAVVRRAGCWGRSSSATFRTSFLRLRRPPPVRCPANHPAGSERKEPPAAEPPLPASAAPVVREQTVRREAARSRASLGPAA
jgi:hypothetical protein